LGRSLKRSHSALTTPPKEYPKNPSTCADPENWRYPLHTPWNAKAARPYFDELPNRTKYTDEERVYIDWRVDEALKRLEQAGFKRTRSPTPNPPTRKTIEELSLETS